MAHAVRNIREADPTVPEQEEKTLYRRVQETFTTIVLAAHPATIWLNICKISTFFKDELLSLIELVKISVDLSYWKKSSEEKRCFCAGGGKYGMEKVHFPKFIYRLPSDWVVAFPFESLAGQETGRGLKKLNKIWEIAENPGYSGPTFRITTRGRLHPHSFPYKNRNEDNVRVKIDEFLTLEQFKKEFFPRPT